MWGGAWVRYTGTNCVLPLQVMTWMVIPIVQSYSGAADFTVRGKLATALKVKGKQLGG
jgi:hypothetical protein